MSEEENKWGELKIKASLGSSRTRKSKLALSEGKHKMESTRWTRSERVGVEVGRRARRRKTTRKP